MGKRLGKGGQKAKGAAGLFRGVSGPHNEVWGKKILIWGHLLPAGRCLDACSCWAIRRLPVPVGTARSPDPFGDFFFGMGGGGGVIRVPEDVLCPLPSAPHPESGRGVGAMLHPSPTSAGLCCAGELLGRAVTLQKAEGGGRLQGGGGQPWRCYLLPAPFSSGKRRPEPGPGPAPGCDPPPGPAAAQDRARAPPPAQHRDPPPRTPPGPPPPPSRRCSSKQALRSCTNWGN